MPQQGVGGCCCRCCEGGRRASPLTCLAVCFLVLTYNLLGGFLFLALEGGTRAESPAAASKPDPAAGDLRARTVERLWAITEDLNILYKENWTKLAAKELLDFQRVLVQSVRGEAAPEGRHGRDADYRWTFSSSFLYALTLITTIGHGSVTPKSPAGKLVAVAYACFGIPIIMLYLSTIGDALARNVRAFYSRLCPASLPCALPDAERRTPFQAALDLDGYTGDSGVRHRHRHRQRQRPCREHTRVPAPLSALLAALYVALGALLFHATERWDAADGCYFSFSSLATIGFGSLRPGAHARTVSPHAEDIAVGACCLYILVGVVVIAMCFNLVREDASSLARGLTALCGARPASAVYGDDKLAVSVLS